MKISKIIINNFRVYRGLCEINLFNNDTKNISVISGNNGFGKTSFLTSLVWCLYGKLMAEVDEKYKHEIYESGGYESFCDGIFNKSCRLENVRKTVELETRLKKEKLAPLEKTELKNRITQLNSFSVSIELHDVLLPSFPCKSLMIERVHNVYNGNEIINILIDGKENELSKEVGSDIFINDFILPKEIAKFFFFDAEKIVSLAETKTTDEKRKLSGAYSEVLGIKKYLDLKSNLENLRTRLKKKAAKGKDKAKLADLLDGLEKLQKNISHYQEKVERLEETLKLKKHYSDQLQEKLIREGATITLDDLKQLKSLKKQLSDRSNVLKGQVKEMTELAPFAIASKLMDQTRKQLQREKSQKQIIHSQTLLNQNLKALKKEIASFAKEHKVNQDILKGITSLIDAKLVKEDKPEFLHLLDYSTEQENKFNTLFSNLTGTYRNNFDQLSKEFKLNQNEYNRVIQKLRKAESKENDSIVEDIRLEKQTADQSVVEIEKEIIEWKAKLIVFNNELNSNNKLISELTKRLDVEERERLKDDTTSRLIEGLSGFITNLKLQKKSSLEERLKKELNNLMHKSDFVNKVSVIIEGELIDFELYDKYEEVIKKEGLSKGEQQLFATALLKALVDESSIQFPVFIDSPLQKLDKAHARNIIKDFYPYVSDQVILFPLLEKELAEQEFEWLMPKISRVHMIKNNERDGSRFEEINPKDVFQLLKENKDHVY